MSSLFTAGMMLDFLQFAIDFNSKYSVHCYCKFAVDCYCEFAVHCYC